MFRTNFSEGTSTFSEFYECGAEFFSKDEATNFKYVVAEMLSLAREIDARLKKAQRDISIPDSLINTHDVVPEYHLHSTTGDVIVVDSPVGDRLAIKILSKRQSDGMIGINKNGLYLMDDVRSRAMQLVGELGMGRLANPNLTDLYYGVAGLEMISPDQVHLDRFNISQVMNGKAEPALVMRFLARDLAAVGRQIGSRQPADRSPFVEKDIAKAMPGIVNRVIGTAIPLSTEKAWKVGSPEAMRALLTENTVGWLLGRTEQNEIVQRNVTIAKQVAGFFSDFIDLPESRWQLPKRALPMIGNKVSHAHSQGDAKFSNLMLDNGVESGQVKSDRIGIIDSQSLILRPGVRDNENPIMAPWPDADIMRVMAFTRSQPEVFGLKKVVEKITEGVREYVGKDWKNNGWHDLYFDILTAYNLLVDVACNIDPLLDAEREGQSPSEQTRYIMTEYAPKALQLVEKAFAQYHEGR